MKVMDKQLISRLKSIFDNIAHKTEEGTEFWFARELQDVLGYTEWRNFRTCHSDHQKPPGSGLNAHFRGVRFFFFYRLVFIWCLFKT